MIPIFKLHICYLSGGFASTRIVLQDILRKILLIIIGSIDSSFAQEGTGVKLHNSSQDLTQFPVSKPNIMLIILGIPGSHNITKLTVFGFTRLGLINLQYMQLLQKH